MTGFRILYAPVINYVDPGKVGYISSDIYWALLYYIFISKTN
jgi:hypothetical protein